MLVVADEELVLDAEFEELDELAVDELDDPLDVGVAAVSDAPDAEAVSVGSEPTPTSPKSPSSEARTLIIRFACLLWAGVLAFALGLASTKAITRVRARSVERRALR